MGSLGPGPRPSGTPGPEPRPGGRRNPRGALGPHLASALAAAAPVAAAAAAGFALPLASTSASSRQGASGTSSPAPSSSPWPAFTMPESLPELPPLPALPNIPLPSIPGLDPKLSEQLSPALWQAAGQWANRALGAAQAYLESQLRELTGGGCPTTAGVLRALLAGAAVQVVSLGLATRFLMLNRQAVLRGQVWRLATWSLVHAGPMHLISNYAALATLGSQFEAVAGPDRAAAAFLASAVASTVASLALNGGRLSLGASGAVFGMGAALARYHAAHVEALPPEAAAALRKAGERAMQATIAYHVIFWSRLDVSAHLGGALAGWAVSSLLGPTYCLERGRWGWGGGGPVFRDRPALPALEDPGLKHSIALPVVGPGYSVGAAAAAATRPPPRLEPGRK